MGVISDALKVSSSPALTKEERYYGTPASIKSQVFTDTTKEAVASPLSAFLASNITGGIPKYTAPTVADYSNQEVSNISKFLSQDADTVFKDNIMDPTLKNFKEVGLQDVREGYAGALSSSGRTSAESNATAQLYADLAGKKAQFGLDMNKAQIEAANALQAAQTAPLAAAYKVWLDSQSAGNENLKNALAFLSTGTSSGSTVATALDPGSTGLYAQIFASDLAQEGINQGKGITNKSNSVYQNPTTSNNLIFGPSIASYS